MNGETVAANDPRLSPEYYAYYYLQRPLDPRLPPPLFNWSNWHYANANKLNDTNKRTNESTNAAANSVVSGLMHGGAGGVGREVGGEQKVEMERKEQPSQKAAQLQNERHNAASSAVESKAGTLSQRGSSSSAVSFPVQPANNRPAADYAAASSAAETAGYMPSSSSYPPHSHYLTATTAAYLTMSPTSSPLTEPLDSYEPLKHFSITQPRRQHRPYPQPPYTQPTLHCRPRLPQWAAGRCSSAVVAVSCGWQWYGW